MTSVKLSKTFIHEWHNVLSDGAPVSSEEFSERMWDLAIALQEAINANDNDADSIELVGVQAMGDNIFIDLDVRKEFQYSVNNRTSKPDVDVGVAQKQEQAQEVEEIDAEMNVPFLIPGFEMQEDEYALEALVDDDFHVGTALEYLINNSSEKHRSIRVRSREDEDDDRNVTFRYGGLYAGVYRSSASTAKVGEWSFSVRDGTTTIRHEFNTFDSKQEAAREAIEVLNKYDRGETVKEPERKTRSTKTFAKKTRKKPTAIVVDE